MPRAATGAQDGERQAFVDVLDHVVTIVQSIPPYYDKPISITIRMHVQTVCT